MEHPGRAAWATGQGHRRPSEGELPVDLWQPGMPHLAQAGHRLGPALNAFADALGDRISGMTGGAAVDRRTAAAGVLRNTCPVAQAARLGCSMRRHTYHTASRAAYHRCEVILAEAV